MPSDRYFDMDVPDSLSVANIVCALVVSTYYKCKGRYPYPSTV